MIFRHKAFRLHLVSQISAVLVWNAEKNVRESGAAREVSSKFLAGTAPANLRKIGGVSSGISARGCCER